MVNSASDGDGSMQPHFLPTSSTSSHDKICKPEELQRKSLTPLRESVYKRAFSLLDEDKDGRILTSDIRIRLDSFYPDLGKNTDPFLRQYFARPFDVLSYDDFYRSVVWEKEDKKIDDLYRAFRNYEKDDSRGSGITAKSLQKMLSKLGEKRTPQECLNMIRMFNPSGDDVINFEDFKVLRFFSTLHKRLEYNIKKQNYRPVGSCGSTTKINGVCEHSASVELLQNSMV